MFWRGNFVVANDVNFLLKEENVSLSQVLEADDILPECRADNKALRQFLTKPEIRAELITLITEEPSKNLELTTQYRHSHIASEVLTSQLATLRDQLAMDTVQMNRLCDFVNKPPPLNPLLASYFSKTIEMLFQRNPKQDWYAHHIICLHVLDLFKSRRDFLPNLLRHISTSAICDVFKCFFSLRDPFDKSIMEWLDEHQVHENLIHIICGTYEPEPLPPPPAPLTTPPTTVTPPTNVADEGARTDALDTNHNDSQPNGEADAGNQNTSQPVNNTNAESNSVAGEVSAEQAPADPHMPSNPREARIREVASANAAALLCEVALENCGVNGWGAAEAGGAGAVLAARLRADGGVRALLQAAFTAPPHAARSALLHAATLLRALLVLPDDTSTGCRCGRVPRDDGPCAVEHAVAPHVPLLHHALLRPPGAGARAGVGRTAEEGVGAARVAVAAVIARLAKAETNDVFKVLLSLGTASVLVDMLFAYPENNFLHAQVLDFVHNALANRIYRDRYAAHLVDECNILTRLMDAFEENEDKSLATSARRAGYMGHVVAMLRAFDLACVDASADVAARWDRFCGTRLLPHLQRLDTPLGGAHPSDAHYEMEESPEMPCGSYDEAVEAAEVTEVVEAAEAAEAVEVDFGDSAIQTQNETDFLRLAKQRFDDTWGDTADADDEEVQQVLTKVTSWEDAAGGGADDAPDDGNWACFSDAFNTDWPEVEEEDPLTMELAQKMLDVFNSAFGMETDKPESALDFPRLSPFGSEILDSADPGPAFTAPVEAPSELPAPEPVASELPTSTHPAPEVTSSSESESVASAPAPKLPNPVSPTTETPAVETSPPEPNSSGPPATDALGADAPADDAER